MQKLRLTIAVALALAGLAGGASAQIISQATDIIADTTWGDNEDTVILQLPIFVKSGATLTILEGTIVRGQPRSGPVVPGSTAGAPGALIVTQRGNIRALGSKDNPIIFTTAAADNINDGVADDVVAPIGFEDEWVPGDVFLDDRPDCRTSDVTCAGNGPLAPLNLAGDQNIGLWGGIAILGNAPTNLANACGIGVGKCTVEGLTIPGFSVFDSTYGGPDVHDNSGIMQYVSVRMGGDELGLANELNGVTLAGVGDGTIFEYVEVFGNFDDGIEWFGGTVNGNNLVAMFLGDDAFDADQGYTGVNQFLFGVSNWFRENDAGLYGTDNGDKTCEFDGDDSDLAVPNVNTVGPDNPDIVGVQPSPWPFQQSVWSNLTGIGSTPDSGVALSAVDFPAVSATPANRGCQVRHGFAGQIRNSIVVNTGTSQAFDVDNVFGVTGWTVVNNIAQDTDGRPGGDLMRVYCSTFRDGAIPLPADELAALSNGDLILTVGAPGAADNNITSAGAALLEEDQTFDPQGNVAGKLDVSLLGANGVLNPRVVAGPVGGGCAGPTEPGTASGAVYRGAFANTEPVLWTTDWTVLNRTGLMGN